MSPPRPRQPGAHPIAAVPINGSGVHLPQYCLRAGAICWVTFPGLTSLQAEIIWNDGIRVGCALSNLLAQPVLDRLIARFGVPARG